jgi:hypothetical protein
MSLESCRRALSQSMSQLHALKPAEVQQLEKKALPPRVPIRRNSGRVHSPPPKGRIRSIEVLQDGDTDETTRFQEESNSFHLEFSESDAFDDFQYASVQQVFEGIQVFCADATIDGEPPNHQTRSVLGRDLRSATLSSDLQIFRRPASISAPNRGPRGDGSGTNHARPRRATSLNDDGLPVLETFPAHPPHLRVLPRQIGSRHLGISDRSDCSISSKQTNMAPGPGNSAASQLDLLSKVASSKVIPGRQSFDLGAMKPELINMDPPTVETAMKKTLWTRRNNRAVKSVNSGRRNESPVPARKATNDTGIPEAS